MRGRLALLSSASIVVACSLGSFDEFSSGPPSEDAGIATSSPVDSAAPTDAGGGSDVATDTGPTGPFCKTLTTQPLACADFDDGTTPARFETKGTVGASFSIDDEGVGGTKAMKFASGTDAGSTDGTCVTVLLGGTRKSLTIEADARLDRIGSNDIDLLTIRYDSDHELGLHMVVDAISFEEDFQPDGGADERYVATTGKLSDVAYRKLKLAVAVDGPVAHGELFVDGVSVGKIDADSISVAGTTTVQFGDSSAIPKNWTLHYDNLVVYETL